MSIYISVFISGLCALIWEVLWLHFAALSIGVSAQAVAIVLSAMMLGIAAGSLFTNILFKYIPHKKNTRLLALLEVLIGFTGIFLATGFKLVETLDVLAFNATPKLTPIIQAISILMVLGLPAFLMGITIPVFARIAENSKKSLARMYATNIMGASAGIVIASFLLIPKLGITNTIKLTVCLNILAAFFAFISKSSQKTFGTTKATPSIAHNNLQNFPFIKGLFVVFCTGFATFSLEVSWFRSLRAALQATTESFAIMLFTVLIALAIGSHLAAILKRSNKIPFSIIIALGGFLVLVTTPILEIIDIYTLSLSGAYNVYMFKRFLIVFITLGPPMCVLGIGLPYILEYHNEKGKVSILYAINTLGAVIGSLLTAWLLMPTLGIAKSAWVAGGTLIIAALILSVRKEYIFVLVLGTLGFMIASSSESGIGKARIQGLIDADKYTVLSSKEGPDSSVSVIETTDQSRHIFIDGFSASTDGWSAHYMEWMGRLPMILHQNPKDALIICFGTGQTVNGVRLEGPQHIDVVDVNQTVFDMASYFPKNENVLKDARVQATVMDGRAFLRRTKQKYDVITLEPMPPTFAGSNSLYSFEFYQLISQSLNNNGVAAQWLPFHLVTAKQSASIVATFIKAFPNSIIWVDPISRHGILLGVKNSANKSIPLQWHGLNKTNKLRNLSNNQIRQSLIFQKDVLQKLAKQGIIITDNNQFLSYGYGRMNTLINFDFQTHNINLLKKIEKQLKTHN